MGRPVLASTPDAQRPEARYHDSTRHSLVRRIVIAGAAIVLASALAGWVWVALVRSNPAVRFEVTAFDTVTDTSVTIEWVVDREPGVAVECVLRARNQAGQEVGRLRVSVPSDGSPSVVVRRRLETSDRPVTGEVLSCLQAGD